MHRGSVRFCGGFFTRVLSPSMCSFKLSLMVCPVNQNSNFHSKHSKPHKSPRLRHFPDSGRSTRRGLPKPQLMLQLHIKRISSKCRDFSASSCVFLRPCTSFCVLLQLLLLRENLRMKRQQQFCYRRLSEHYITSLLACFSSSFHASNSRFPSSLLKNLCISGSKQRASSSILLSDITFP